MSKGIIVVNDTPVICAECNFATITQNGGYLRCEAENRVIYNAKPDWCPIREIPVKLEEIKTPHSMGDYQRKEFQRGWNSCIDAIERR